MSEKLHATWRLSSFVALATTAAIWTALPTTANAADAAAGKQLFQDKTCSACHSIGQGPLVGPDLKGIARSARMTGWCNGSWHRMPCSPRRTSMRSSCCTNIMTCRCPISGSARPKPRTSWPISKRPERVVGGGSSAPAKEAAPAPAGNADTGKDLFTGVQRFANGGPPCMACHSTGGIGALGGGQLGPDFTTVPRALVDRPASAVS